MAVNLTTAANALKTIYLDPAREQLNIETNPFYNKIEKTSKRIDGTSVKVYLPYGVNGGVGASSETSALPTSSNNASTILTTSLKDMYATIEISQKAIDLTKSNAASFVNLLSDTMEKTIKSAKFMFSRQLFTDGTGVIGTVSTGATNATQTLNSVKYLTEGMLIQFYASDKTTQRDSGTTRTILSVNRAENTILLSASIATTTTDVVVNQLSLANELTGLAAIFGTGDVYGTTSRSTKAYLLTQNKALNAVIDDLSIQTVIDLIEENAGVAPDYLSCSFGVRRAYVDYLSSVNRNVNTLDLAGGFKSIVYNGLPLVADRHEANGTLRMLSSSAFALNRPADWQWMTEDGAILKQVAGYAKYTASLYQYAELTCQHFVGQGMLTGITEA